MQHIQTSKLVRIKNPYFNKNADSTKSHFYCILERLKNESNKFSFQTGSLCYHRDKDVNDRRPIESEGQEKRDKQ